jgi:flagellar basal-body rod protein FlgC
MSPMKISATALNVEWQRLQVIATNLANMNTTRAAGGGMFQPMRLVSGPAVAGFESVLKEIALPPVGVHVIGVEPTGAPPRVSHDPSHPDADSFGMVTYPGVDHAEEMTGLIQASRVYEANLAAFGIGQQMMARALELGRSQ